MLVLFLVVPLGMAGYLVKLGQGSDTTAGLVEESESGFSDGKPFVAEGKLSSPSGESLTSMHQQKPCLAYRIKFDLRHTVTDSDGEEEDRRLELFEERHQVPDLTAEFANGKALLDIQTFTEFYKPHFEELEKLPEYVPYERIPKVKTDRFWFEVFETTYVAERTYTVAGQTNSVGILEPHPELRQILIFPGTRTECAEAMTEEGRGYRIMALVMVCLSFVGCLVLGLILKFMRD